jgi:hypothetical protein
MKIFRNILAVILGAIVGSTVNLAIIAIGPALIPNPVGFDNSTTDNFVRTVHLLQPVNYIVPFAAHALGTLAGSLVAMFVAASHRIIIAGIIGVLFLTGGIIVTFIAPIPVWVIIVDLLLAYIPWAYLGYKLSGKE